MLVTGHLIDTGLIDVTTGHSSKVAKVALDPRSFCHS